MKGMKKASTVDSGYNACKEIGYEYYNKLLNIKIDTESLTEALLTEIRHNYITSDGKMRIRKAKENGAQWTLSFSPPGLNTLLSQSPVSFSSRKEAIFHGQQIAHQFDGSQIQVHPLQDYNKTICSLPQSLLLFTKSRWAQGPVWTIGCKDPDYALSLFFHTFTKPKYKTLKIAVQAFVDVYQSQEAVYFSWLKPFVSTT